jgi:hypothetical protein
MDREFRIGDIVRHVEQLNNRKFKITEQLVSTVTGCTFYKIICLESGKYYSYYPTNLRLVTAEKGKFSRFLSAHGL